MHFVMKEKEKYTIADNGEYLVGEEAIKYEENEFGPTAKRRLFKEVEELEYTCCGDEITGEVEDVGLCPTCLEHI